VKRRPIEGPAPIPERPTPKLDKLDIHVDAVNEQILVIAACIDTEVRKGLTQRLRPDVFLADEHQVIWEGLTEIARRDLAFDIATLHQLTGGKADTPYLETLLASRTEVPPNLKHHVEMLLWDRARVECVRGPLPELLRTLQDTAAPADRVRAMARSVATSLEGGSGYRGLMSDPRRLRDRAEALLDELADEHYPFGIPGLDLNDDGTRRLTTGTMPGKITVITAVSGACKSLISGQIALHQGPGIPRIGDKGLGRKVLMGAWEMPPDMLCNLFACMSLGLDRTKMLSGLLSREDRTALAVERERISSYVRFVDQPVTKGKHANEDALSAIHGMVIDSACEVAVLDLWERAFEFKGPEEEKTNLIRTQDIAKITNTHLILTAQQNLKQVENRPDKRPSRETIMGSGGWVQIADTILGSNVPGLWREIPKDIIEILVLKQRYGDWPLLIEADHDPRSGLTFNCRPAELKRYVAPAP